MNGDGYYEAEADGNLSPVTSVELLAGGVSFEEVSNGPPAPVVGETLTFVEISGGSTVGDLVVSDLLYVFQEGHLPPGEVGYEIIAGDIKVTGHFGSAPCFVGGTQIATSKGNVAVDDLVVGTDLTLATGGHGRLVWIGHRRQQDCAVVRLKKDALERNVPNQDLVVSVDHGIFLSGVLVQAGLLVNGNTIVKEFWPVVTFWHVELEDHGIILAEGTPTESYLDTGNRAQFGNCAIRYEPSRNGARASCAETIFDGPVLSEIKSRLPSTC